MKQLDKDHDSPYAGVRFRPITKLVAPQTTPTSESLYGDIMFKKKTTYVLDPESVSYRQTSQ